MRAAITARSQAFWGNGVVWKDRAAGGLRFVIAAAIVAICRIDNATVGERIGTPTIAAHPYQHVLARTREPVFRYEIIVSIT